jgi:hypothetical protein
LIHVNDTMDEIVYVVNGYGREWREESYSDRMENEEAGELWWRTSEVE